jgi:hypothetical protein
MVPPADTAALSRVALFTRNHALIARSALGRGVNDRRA